ncbi:hypothetical protein [Kushneria marisflavi]|uniref:hypothetical protein n=1 Tax=Kushneria marisflavi TaxID=157779 RepID=UPI000E740BAF|nr:hypothetical protein [Kushneria marisflavi]RKD75786.1 hypothetical protein C8D96_3360 [Kushneria marisflavi]
MSRSDILTRLKKLEAAVTEEYEPLIIILNCVDGKGENQGPRSIIIAGSLEASGDTLHREEGEAEDDFLNRAQKRCAEIHRGKLSAELELR